MPAASQGYSAGKFGIELEGKFAGLIASVEGGEPFGVVEEEPLGNDGVIRKHISTVKYNPITLRFGSGMTDEFYSWIAEFFAQASSARAGAIVFMDYQLREKERLEWTNGLITEVTFPALNGGAKDPALLSVTITPESTVVVPAAGKSQTNFGTKKQKSWVRSNYRFSMAGLESASTKVRSIDALTFRQPVVVNAEGRVTQGPLIVPNLVFSVAASQGQPWMDWVQDFFASGKPDPSLERDATIELRDPTLKNTLVTLQLKNCGIVRASRQRQDGNLEVIAEVVVECFCETAAFVNAPEVVAANDPDVDSTNSNTSGNAAVNAPLSQALLSVLLDQRFGDNFATVLNTEAGPANPEVRAKLVAARLKSAAVAPVSNGNPRREDGVALGEKWASERAALGELEQVARLEAADWTALKLGDEHTLIRHLQEAKLIPAGAQGAFELERDEFVEGVISGAANVLRQATPHLKPSPADRR